MLVCRARPSELDVRRSGIGYQRRPAISTRLELARADRSMTTRNVWDRRKFIASSG